MSASTDPAVRSLVASVLWPGFLGRTAPDWLLHALDEGLAGVVYFGQNIDPEDAEQLPALSARLRESRPGALLGVDEEGGPVTRLEAALGSTLPSASQLGRVDDTAVTRAAGVELARRLRASGANVALAPVADVNTNPRNPVIGTRAFGATADLVGRHVAAMVSGIQAGGVAACVKHFPGHGDTAVDSHLGLPHVTLPGAEVEAEHLPPFQAAIDAGVAAVMTSHVVVDAFGDLPATLDPRVLGMLRDRGFAGTIITDALDMAAIRSEFGAGPGAVRAILAGADLLCIGNPSDLGPKHGATSDLDDYAEVRDALLAAVDDGTLPIAALERASHSVAGLSDWTAAASRAGGASTGEVGAFDARQVVREAIVVRGTVSVAAGDRVVLDLRDRASGAVASTAEPFSVALGATRVVVGPFGGRDVVAAMCDALGGIPESSAVVALVDAVQPGSPQRRALGILAAARPSAVIVNTGLPAPDELALPGLDTYGSSRVTAQVVSEAFEGVAA
ncbi:glycoside hydrolase family 3 protein [Leifsonia naganoensis]|uniref:Beta-N-acetylhexosaminidase n=1 Tax=Leifsonia naganoensis TaxID=150025 RepID=A0A853DMQ9_9MICO|nr:glycoside hydrolase family 3 N-terminal domain-containing protein [Leifsonia naganoensis]NYK09577.1 beta-N-acetylhexosaminidase [Leifsonia naganoensis]